MGSAIRSEKKAVSTLQTENMALRNKLDQANEKIAALSATAAAGKNAMAAPAAESQLKSE